MPRPLPLTDGSAGRAVAAQLFEQARGGSQTRSVLSTVQPEHGGMACPVDTVEQQDCLGQPCPVCNFNNSISSRTRRCHDEYQDTRAATGRHTAIQAYSGRSDGCRGDTGNWAAPDVPCSHIVGLTQAKCHGLCMDNALAGGECKFVFWSLPCLSNSAFF